MTHIISDVSAYAEGKLDAELASKGLTSQAVNPYQPGSIYAHEYERGARDAQPKTRMLIRSGNYVMAVEV